MRLLLNKQTGRLKEVITDDREVEFQETCVRSDRLCIHDLNKDNAILVEYNKEIPSNWRKFLYYYLFKSKKLVRLK